MKRHFPNRLADQNLIEIVDLLRRDGADEQFLNDVVIRWHGILNAPQLKQPPAGRLARPPSNRRRCRT